MSPQITNNIQPSADICDMCSVSILDMSLKIIDLRLQQNLPRVNELICAHMNQQWASISLQFLAGILEQNSLYCLCWHFKILW